MPRGVDEESKTLLCPLTSFDSLKKLGFPQYVRDNMFLIMKHELQKGDQED